MTTYIWLHLCWWRTLVTKWFDDNFEMLATVSAVFCHQKPQSFNISVGHQYSKDVTNTKKLPLTLSHQHLRSPYVFVSIYLSVKLKNMLLIKTNPFLCSHVKYRSRSSLNDTNSNRLEIFEFLWSNFWPSVTWWQDWRVGSRVK